MGKPLPDPADATGGAGESTEVPMTIDDDVQRIVRNGPCYFSQPIYAAMVDLLVRRGVSDAATYNRVVSARSVWTRLSESTGLRELSEVTPDVIRAYRETLAETGIAHKSATSYVSNLGTLVYANTGINPYTDATARRSDPDDVMEAAISKSRFADLLRAYVADMRKRCLKEITVGDNVAIVVRTLDRLDELIGTDWTMEDLGLDELSLLRMSSVVSERTCKRQIDALRRFTRFVTGRDPVNARLNWNVSDEYAPGRRFISVEEFRLLLEYADSRMRLILALGGAMGLRRAEIAGIRLDDICGDALMIRGKGHGPDGKAAVLRIPTPVSAAIEEYLRERSAYVSMYGDRSDGRLLIQTGRDGGRGMTPDGVGDLVRRFGLERGVDLTTHSLRRLYATTLADAGTDLDTLRRMMRHSNVQTTLTCYVNANPAKMARASDAVEEALFGRRPPDGAGGGEDVLCRTTLFAPVRRPAVSRGAGPVT